VTFQASELVLYKYSSTCNTYLWCFLSGTEVRSWAVRGWLATSFRDRWWADSPPAAALPVSQRCTFSSVQSPRVQT